MNLADKHAELVAAQASQRAIIDDTLKRLDQLQKDGEPLPEDMTRAGKEASAEYKRLGEELTKVEAEQKQRAADANALRQQLAIDAPALTDTLITRDRFDTQDPDRDNAEITRATVGVLHELIAKAGGSRAMRDLVRPESEAIVLDMLTTPPQERASKGALWSSKRQSLQRAPVQVGSTDALGGYLMPEDNTFMNQVQLAEHATGGCRNHARIITTMDGNVMPVPDTTETVQTGASVAENVAVSDVELTFGETVMRQSMTTSGRLEATFQAVQDAGVNLPMLLGIIAGERIVRREDELFIVGTGAQNVQPEGLATAYTDNALELFRSHGQAMNGFFGLTTTSGDDDAVVGLLRRHFATIRRAVNAGWRRRNHVFLLSDTLDAVFSDAPISAADQRLLFEKWFESGTSKGEPLMYAGVTINTDYSIDFPNDATVGTTAVGFVGDFSQYWIRRINGMYMIEDRYTGATQMKTHWIFGRRCDARGLFKVAPRTNGTPAIRRVVVTNRA